MGKLMKYKISLLCFVALQISFFSPYCSAQETRPMPKFNNGDHILILAPHPDDEAIGTGGIIQNALKAGAKVKVVCFTNGDHNELAFIVYEKRLTFRSGEFVHMGEVRMKETAKAMKILGLQKDDIVLLGYPDFGTMEILLKYWGKTRSFKDIMTRISHVPYPECLSPNAPYVGESILSDLKKVLLDFKPTKIFVSHPVDVNRDHRSLYLFLRVALWDIKKAIKAPEIFPYLIHVFYWPTPRGYHPNLRLNPPEVLKNSEIRWHELNLTDDEIKAKYEAISCYKSEIEYSPTYLFTFDRKNELFGDYPVIKLSPIGGYPQASKDKEGKIEWHDADIAKEGEPGKGVETNFLNLAYTKTDKDLLIKISLKNKIEKNLGISATLLGYSNNKDFSAMPKINIYLGMNGMRIRDKRKIIYSKDTQAIYQDKSLIIKVPISILGDPDYILAYVRTQVNVLPFSSTAWRILEL